MLQDWQVDVQSGVAASTTTFLSKSGTTLKDFIETLNVNTTALDARYLTASSYPDMAAMYASLQPDYGNLVDEVTLSIDGVDATVTPDPQTGRSRSLEVDLNAVRSVTQTARFGSGYWGQSITDTLVKGTDTSIYLQRWRRPRLVASNDGSFLSGTTVPLSELSTLPASYIVPFYRNVGGSSVNADVDSDHLSYNSTTKKFTTLTEGVYSYSVSVALRPSTAGLLPADNDALQLTVLAGSVGGIATATSTEEYRYHTNGDSSMYLEVSRSNIYLGAGAEIWAVVTKLTALNNNWLEIWAAQVAIYREE